MLLADALKFNSHITHTKSTKAHLNRAPAKIIWNIPRSLLVLMEIVVFLSQLLLLRRPHLFHPILISNKWIQQLFPCRKKIHQHMRKILCQCLRVRHNLILTCRIQQQELKCSSIPKEIIRSRLLAPKTSISEYLRVLALNYHSIKRVIDYANFSQKFLTSYLIFRTKYREILLGSYNKGDKNCSDW